MKALLAPLVVLSIVVGEARHNPDRRGPRPPPFLRNVTSEARRQFFQIVNNMNETVAQQKQQVMSWAEANGIQVNAAFTFQFTLRPTPLFLTLCSGRNDGTKIFWSLAVLMKD